MKWIDLHIHSTASDGTVAPEAIPKMVLATFASHQKQNETEKRYIENNIEKNDIEYIIALTDHDTMAGVERCQKAAENIPGFTAISGIEFSCVYGGHSVHMLGLDVDIYNQAFQEKVAYYRNSRDTRNDRMIEKFAALGIQINREEIKVAEGESLGRPHIARYLMDKGIISSINEGFDKYLAEGKPCYADRERPTPAEAVQIILQAGGHPVLAHLTEYKGLTREEMEALVAELKQVGLEGIETYHADFSEEETRFVESLSEKYDLFRTGGSDFHGENKPGLELGYGYGNLGRTMGKIDYTKIM